MTDMPIRREDDPEIVVYNNPAAVLPHERNHKFYAVSPEGCGSYGETPEEACQLLAPILHEYKQSNAEGRHALVSQAQERVAEIRAAGGRIHIDAD